jgi:Domain of Unknown Function (DUF748)
MMTFQKIIRSKVLITLVAVLVLYTLSGFFLAPHLVSRLLPGLVAEKLHAELNMGSVKMNPFLLTFQVEDVVLHDPDGTLLAGFEQFFMDVELSSIFRWALVFKSFRLDGPRVNVMIDDEGVLNFSRLIIETTDSDDSDTSLEQENVDTAPPRLVFKHIEINEGEIDYTDQRQSVPAVIAISPLNIELNDISTLYDRKGPYNLAATTREQASFEWTGDVSLNPLKSTGSLSFSNIKLSTAWQFMRDSLVINKPEGLFSFKTNYEIDLGQAQPSVRFNDLEFNLAELVLQNSGEESPLLVLSRLDIDIPSVDMTRHTVHVDRILFENGSTAVDMDEKGRLNWSRILADTHAKDQTPAKKPPQANTESPQVETDTPWKVEIGAVAFKDIQVHHQDQSRSPVLKGGVGDIDGGFQLSLVSGQKGTDLKVRDALFDLQDIQVGNPESAEPEICIDHWRVQGGEFDLSRNALTIQGIYVQDGEMDVRREEDGRLNLVNLFAAESGTDEKAPDPPGDTNGLPFQFLIEEVGLSNFGLSFSDQTVKPDGEILHLDNVHVAVSQIDGKRAIPVDMSFDVRQGGHVEIQGRIDPLAPSVQTDIQVASLSLIPFEPYLTSLASLALASGSFSTQGRFAYQEKESQPRIAYDGTFDIADLKILETASKKTLLGWEHFQTSGLTFRLQPDMLEIADLKLSGLDGQFIIFEDGSLNLVNAFKRDSDDAKEPAAPDDTNKEGTVFPVHIHKLRVEEGGLFFADYSLRPQFATKIHQLDGSIIGMSSEPGARAQVQLDGRVNDYGLSKIKGEINFFEPAVYTDMSVLFRNLEMTRLTPYSGKFVGRRIDSGKLSLDLKYFIENNKLKGDNQIIVERIELGDKIDSADAVSLPLNLAIAILEDADGVIDIGLPVTGDLTDPKFSYGQLVWKAFANLIKKIATAPFRALGALLGGDSEKLDAIMFENGSAELLPPEMEKLANLALALEKRPNLKLLVQGRYSEKKDGMALKALQMRRLIAERQGLILASDEDPGMVDFGSPATQLVLETLYAERYGPETLAGIKADMEPLSAETLEQADTSNQEIEIQDPAGLWKNLYERLIDDEPLAESALIQLSQSRSQAIVQELHAARGIPVERIAVKEPKILKPGKPAQAKLALEVLRAKREKGANP